MATYDMYCNTALDSASQLLPTAQFCTKDPDLCYVIRELAASHMCKRPSHVWPARRVLCLANRRRREKEHPACGAGVNDRRRVSRARRPEIRASIKAPGFASGGHSWKFKQYTCSVRVTTAES